MKSDLEVRKKFQAKDFPLSAKYDPYWVHKHEMGPNVLWFTEALCQKLELKPGMRVLDLGCGTAMSSIFLAKEYGVQVWATDLWIKASENLGRIHDEDVEDTVFPIHADARMLPFANEFFDAIVSIDSYHYFGTDVHYLEFSLLKMLKQGGQIGMVSPASPIEIPRPFPEHLGDSWYWMNSVEWWKNHWERCPGLAVEIAELLPGGWELWVRWHEFLNSFDARNRADEGDELTDLLADKGKYLGFVRMIGRRTETDPH